jgi:hypothetical protein
MDLRVAPADHRARSAGTHGLHRRRPLDRLNPPERVMAFRLAPLQALLLLLLPPPLKFQDVCIVIVPNGIDSRLPGGRHSETPGLPCGSIRKWIAGEQEEQSLILLCRQTGRQTSFFF